MRVTQRRRAQKGRALILPELRTNENARAPSKALSAWSLKRTAKLFRMELTSSRSGNTDNEIRRSARLRRAVWRNFSARKYSEGRNSKGHVRDVIHALAGERLHVMRTLHRNSKVDYKRSWVSPHFRQHFLTREINKFNRRQRVNVTA